MKSLLQSLLIIGLFSANASAISLKSGDIILQSNDCYMCKLIEAEENSSYSHIGILIYIDGTWNVLDSLSNVKMSPLNEFLNHRRKETTSLIIRANRHLLKNELKSRILLDHFENNFAGLNYDSQFLWDNSDSKGEKLYCSEFIAKFLQPYLLSQIPTKPMHFELNREFWIRHFHGNPPDGLPGLSPGDFERSPLFHKIGTI